MEPLKITRRDTPLTHEEMLYVARVISNYMEAEIAKGHPLAVLYNDALAYRLLEYLQNSGRLEVYEDDDDYIVGVLGYDIIALPWSDRKILREMTMFAIDVDFCGFSRAAVDRLNELAIENDCVLIETGDALNVNTSMTRNIYMKRGGFTGSYPCYFKTIVPQLVQD